MMKDMIRKATSHPTAVLVTLLILCCAVLVAFNLYYPPEETPPSDEASPAPIYEAEITPPENVTSEAESHNATIVCNIIKVFLILGAASTGGLVITVLMAERKCTADWRYSQTNHGSVFPTK